MTFGFSPAPTTSLINVTSGVGTLDELYTDIGNATIMSKQDENVYTITSGGGVCVLQLGEGVQLTISAGNVLRWNMNGHKWGIFHVGAGSKLIVGQGAILDFAMGSNYLTSVWLHGATEFNGTSSFPIVMQHAYQVSLRHFAGDENDSWEYVTVQDGLSSTSEAGLLVLFENYHGEKVEGIFNNITLKTTGGYYNNAIGFYCGDYSACVFNNFTIDSCYFGVVSYGANFKMTNSTIKNTYYWSIFGPPSGGGYYYSKLGSPDQSTDTLQQPKVTFENCVFENNSSTENDAALYNGAGGIVKLKDCTVKDNSYGFYPVGLSKFLYQGDITYTNITTANKISAYSACHFEVNYLDLTVEDYDGNPIQGASVEVKQASGYEEWKFKTDEGGKIKDCFGDYPVFVNNEDPLDGTKEKWSDSIEEGRYHLITVSKEGFQTWQRRVEFIDDLVVVAKLRIVGGPTILGHNLC